MPKHLDSAHDRSPRTASGAMAATLLGLAASSTALAQVGTFTIRMNDGAVHSVGSVASFNAEPGTLRFTGSAVDPGGQWEATWDYVADLNPHGNAKIVGEALVFNKSAAPADFDVRFRVPVCPLIMNGAKMGGSVTIKLTASENGGIVSCPPGQQAFAAMADDVIGAKLFHGPFNMGTTGSGTAQTMNLFGAPFPNMNVPAVAADFGVRHIFKLSDADKVSFVSNLVLGGDPNNFVECAQQAAAAAPAQPVQPASPAAPAVPAAPPAVQQAAVDPVAPNAPSTSSTVVGAGSDSGKRVISTEGSAKKNAAPKRAAPRNSPADRAKSSQNRSSTNRR